MPMKKSTGVFLFLLLASVGANALLAQVPTIAGVYNAELANIGIKDTRFSPGSTIAIYGTGFPPGANTQTTTAPVSGVTVNVGGIAGWVFDENGTSGLIEAEIPTNAPIGATQVTVTTSA